MFSSKMEMARGFDDLMNRTYRLRKDFQRHEREENLVKTHIVELHAGGKLLHSKSKLEETMHRLASHSGADLMSTSDWTFFGLMKNNLNMYVEVVDDRFALLHSASRADAVEKYVQTVTRELPFVDQAWLPSSFLESAKGIGIFRGFRLRHDNWLSVKHRGRNKESNIRKFSLNLTLTEGADEALAQLRNVKALSGAVNVAGIELRVQGSSDPDRFALSDVYSSGKVMARGTSFQLHHDFVLGLCDRYASHIRNVEQRFSVALSRTERGITVEGVPIEIEFVSPLTDVALFCENLLSGVHPFRLWGVPEFIAPDYVSVTAVDLHVGHTIMFEVAPEFMRVYLPPGTCGNTILRLITNLQGHSNSEIRISHQGVAVSFDSN
jgi:hypothetical protein